MRLLGETLSYRERPPRRLTRRGGSLYLQARVRIEGTILVVGRGEVPLAVLGLVEGPVKVDVSYPSIGELDLLVGGVNVGLDALRDHSRLNQGIDGVLDPDAGLHLGLQLVRYRDRVDDVAHRVQPPFSLCWGFGGINVRPPQEKVNG